MERKIYIYKITNLINNKIYIGQSVSTKHRWQAHKRSVKKPTQVIHHALAKYGIDNFKFEVIASCLDQDTANDTETVIVFQENSLIPNGYNVSNGGSTAPKTEEWKQKMSSKMKGKHFSPETEFRKGHQHIPEVLAVISAKNTGHKAWNKDLPKEKQPWFGRIISEEHRNNLSKANRGGKFSEEQIHQIRKEYWMDNISSIDLGKKYQVSEATIRDIAKLRIYDQIPVESDLVIPKRKVWTKRI